MARLTEAKAHGKLEINGESTIFPPMPIKNLIAQVAAILINHTMESRDFSTLTLRLSKRPIIDSGDTELDQFMLTNAQYINQVHEDDLIEGTQITWAQYATLRETDEWANRFRLQTDPQSFTESEAQAIKKAYDDRFLGTEFYGIGLKI